MGSPVDSNSIPEPWDMPGYTDQVIMAAGAFTQGSSIGRLLVILHLPFPVISNFLPKELIFSNIITLLPFEAALIADIIPAGPPTYNYNLHNKIILSLL